jgi:hypothetical protein
LMTTIGWWVHQRTRELGVRMALGASRRQITRLVFRQGLVLGGAGISAGSVAAAGLTRYLEGWIYGVTPLDATTFAACAVGMLIVAASAVYLPCDAPSRSIPSSHSRRSSSPSATSRRESSKSDRFRPRRRTVRRISYSRASVRRGCQFRISVIGLAAGPCTRVFMRKRDPSADTMYCGLDAPWIAPPTEVGKSGVGAPTSSDPPVDGWEIGTAISCPSSAMKNSSLPSRRQRLRAAVDGDRICRQDPGTVGYRSPNGPTLPTSR